MIIVVGGEKGGSGKSTLATNLASLLTGTSDRFRVALLDADPQGTATNWYDRRCGAGLPTDSMFCCQKSGNVTDSVKKLSEKYDIVVVDCGGRDSKELRSSMLVADILIIPLQASIADIETMPLLIDMIANARIYNKNMVVDICIFNAPTTANSTILSDSKEALVELLGDGTVYMLPEIKSRIAYRKALSAGANVAEIAEEKAALEMRVLIRVMLENYSSSGAQDEK